MPAYLFLFLQSTQKSAKANVVADYVIDVGVVLVECSEE